MSTAPALSIEGLKKVYAGGFEALKGIDLRVEQGDFFALLGPNGAGKSTTIGVICSLVVKSSGRVAIFGFDIDREFAAAKRMIGVVPQEFNFSIFERVGDIVETQAGFYGLGGAQSRRQTEKYLRKLGLWDKRNEQARHLSGGMKRRLMIARALVHEPRLLILDEPTAGVDIEIRRSMWSFLREMNEAGTTIILTTHYLEEAESLCRNIAIIDNGEIVENTSMRELLQQLGTETLVLDLADPLSEVPNLEPFVARRTEAACLEVDIDKGQNLNEVFARLDAAGIRVRSMRNKSNRLEQLFVALTQSDGSTETLVHAAG
ncbi:MAG: ABC transporter ATP-binding protein [Gammaproteobacteria bacterium]|nr:MAG: ABC transporter ATP-binding protein [Gammaproteobacteria bacterium]